MDAWFDHLDSLESLCLVNLVRPRRWSLHVFQKVSDLESIRNVVLALSYGFIVRRLDQTGSFTEGEIPELHLWNGFDIFDQAFLFLILLLG